MALCYAVLRCATLCDCKAAADHNEDAGFTGPDPDVDIVEVDEDSTPGFGNEQRGEDMSMDDKSCIREHATNMVKTRGVKAGRLAFDLWYEHAQTTPQLSVYTPI